MERIRIELSPAEYDSLARFAERELRPLPDQVRHLVRQALRRRGLLREEMLPARRIAEKDV